MSRSFKDNQVHEEAKHHDWTEAEALDIIDRIAKIQILELWSTGYKAIIFILQILSEIGLIKSIK